MTGAELQTALQLHSRANPDFFDTLVALRFLERDGDGADARYRNTPETALFLDRHSPQFMGGFLEMANARLYRFWGDLTEGLRTGSPQNEIKHTGASMFAELYSKPERLEQFMDAMSGISAGNFQAFAEKFDFSRYRTVCDVGGATGQLSMLVARKTPSPSMHVSRIFRRPPRSPNGRSPPRDSPIGSRRGSLDFFAEPAAEGRRDHDGHDPSRLESGEEDAPRPRRLRCPASRRRIRRRRESDRRRAARKRVRADDVAQHADRVRRRIRLHGR